jgi:hypothetical protein
LRGAVEQLNALWDDSTYTDRNTKGLAVWVAEKDDILGDSQMVARFNKIIGQRANAIIQNPSKAA